MEKIGPRERGQDDEAGRDDGAIATVENRDWGWIRNHV
jgi:hypothetical protein